VVADAVRQLRLLPGDALRTAGTLPAEAAAILVPSPAGSCPAFDRAGGHLCSIQRALGHERLPASCRHFPRVTLLEPDATRVTLSHFCPTAASMLFRQDVGKTGVVSDAPGITDRLEHDGFDATQTIPPLLRPGVVMDRETCRLWEQYLLGAFDQDCQAPEDMLADVAGTCEGMRGWSAGRQSLEAHARNAVSAAMSPGIRNMRRTMALSGASRLFLLAAESIPSGLARPVPPDGAEALDRAWVMPRWTAFSRPLGRYLAARSFAAWSAYLGEGLRTQVAVLAVALAAVRIEAVREAIRAARPLDEGLLLAAIRAADLLLHHLSDTPALVRSLAAIEQGPAPAFLAVIGLKAAG
jgi:hypothetical protein